MSECFAYVSAYHICLRPEEARKGCQLPGAGLQMITSHCIDVGTEPGSSAKAAGALNG